MSVVQRALGQSGFSVAPLVFGGNVFGWTADQQRSFSLLSHFVENGFNAIDTADVYSAWIPGNQGGESETIIGQWLKANPAYREKVVIITKVGSPFAEHQGGLSAAHITKAVEDSLRRLQTDYIDVYLSHRPDTTTPIEETLRAYEQLIQQGKIRSIGASNYSAAQLAEALESSEKNNLPAYTVLQPEYNLHARNSYEGELRDLAIAKGLGVIPYFALASGFLTGKYRSEADFSQYTRGERVKKYFDKRGKNILTALDSVAEQHHAKPAEIALAWLLAREGVTAPIASATTIAQLDSLIAGVKITLTEDQLTLLNQQSDY